MTEKPLKCPFWKKCHADPPEGINCDQNYLECEYYGAAQVIMTIPLPTVCPLERHCRHTSEHSHCWITPEDEWDYRDCEYFSKWFWEQRAKGK